MWALNILNMHILERLMKLNLFEIAVFDYLCWKVTLIMFSNANIIHYTMNEQTFTYLAIK